MLKDLAKANNEGIDKISDTIERTIVQRFELQGQQLSRLHRDVLSTSSQPAQVSLQQTQTRQQVVHFLLTVIQECYPNNCADIVLRHRILRHYSLG